MPPLLPSSSCCCVGPRASLAFRKSAEDPMKFGLFYEISIPRPWTRDTERMVYNNCLEQVNIAAELGFDHVWPVEHHFLEEYSHPSAPDPVLTASPVLTKPI